jgi:hypothetical protein
MRRPRHLVTSERFIAPAGQLALKAKGVSFEVAGVFSVPA